MTWSPQRFVSKFSQNNVALTKGQKEGNCIEKVYHPIQSTRNFCILIGTVRYASFKSILVHQDFPFWNVYSIDWFQGFKFTFGRKPPYFLLITINTLLKQLELIAVVLIAFFSTRLHTSFIHIFIMSAVMGTGFGALNWVGSAINSRSKPNLSFQNPTVRCDRLASFGKIYKLSPHFFFQVVRLVT